jgi:drug/metabolite transporter (DMT)-like permease
MRPATPGYLQGAACGLAAAAIWAGWSTLTRRAVTGSLGPVDIATLRYGIAGLLLLPVVVRRGLAFDRLGWGGLAVILTGAGVPYALLAAAGLRAAPAWSQAALNPGSVPLFAALIAAGLNEERLAPARRAGLALIAAGALVILCRHAAEWSGMRLGGAALSLTAAFLWAAFTVTMRRTRLEPLHAAALVATGSAAIWLPIYALLRGLKLPPVASPDLAIQAVYQGILVTIVSLLLYGRAVTSLGSAGGAAFGALVPALAALFAIPLLGEWPDVPGWVAIGLISGGVYLASGGPLRQIADRIMSAATLLHKSEAGCGGPTVCSTSSRHCARRRGR